MAYHELTKDSGGDAISRRAEASRILDILKDCDLSELKQTQQNFIEEMDDDRSVPISAKQLFWLRDIKDKVT